MKIWSPVSYGLTTSVLAVGFLYLAYFADSDGLSGSEKQLLGPVTDRQRIALRLRTTVSLYVRRSTITAG